MHIIIDPIIVVPFVSLAEKGGLEPWVRLMP
jgi:hypothetical protein